MGVSKENDKSYLIAELPEDLRPRERLFNDGAGALSDIELIGIILRTGSAGKSTLDLARLLLQHFQGDLAELAAATPTEFMRIKGIGAAKAAQLKATFTLASRMARKFVAARVAITSPAEAADYFREVFRGQKQESLRTLLLNTKNYIIREELITLGLLDRSQAHAREVFRSAIQHAAAKIILAHNHPSGDPSPSRHDIDCTRELVEAGSIIGIEIVDHIIVGSTIEEGRNDYFSFRENGLIA